MSRDDTVLVLGAYGGSGRAVAPLLVERTGARVIAAGRKRERLAAVVDGLDPGRVSTQIVDVADLEAVAGACARAALVINCVGPYLRGGAEVAAIAIDSGASYIDFASEQAHYECLRRLHDRARERDCFMLTGAGLVPGISGLLALRGVSGVGSPEAVEIVYAQLRSATTDGGLGSLMTGVLEAGQQPIALRGGARVEVRLGDDRRHFELPPPFGSIELVGLPTLENLALAERFALSSTTTYYLLANVPPIFFTMLRVLQPHRRPWAYRLVQRILEVGERNAHRRSDAAGVPIDALLRVVVRGESGEWTGSLRLPAGGQAPTAYLAVIAAQRFLQQRFAHTGLITPIDAFSSDDLAEMEDLLGLGVNFEETKAP